MAGPSATSHASLIAATMRAGTRTTASVSGLASTDFYDGHPPGPLGQGRKDARKRPLPAGAEKGAQSSCDQLLGAWSRDHEAGPGGHYAAEPGPEQTPALGRPL
ncbi:hypothetical protein GCM10009578_083910 [Streptomyces rhizosphaericus]|uniref:Uncharacterized protein n=1 Tax=Streptomyces rhizosphaericus TaxID=114699 RepID=A0ABP4ANJ5_9ACTN